MHGPLLRLIFVGGASHSLSRLAGLGSQDNGRHRARLPGPAVLVFARRPPIAHRVRTVFIFSSSPLFFGTKATNERKKTYLCDLQCVTGNTTKQDETLDPDPDGPSFGPRGAGAADARPRPGDRCRGGSAAIRQRRLSGHDRRNGHRRKRHLLARNARQRGDPAGPDDGLHHGRETRRTGPLQPDRLCPRGGRVLDRPGGRDAGRQPRLPDPRQPHPPQAPQQSRRIRPLPHRDLY